MKKKFTINEKNVDKIIQDALDKLAVKAARTIDLNIFTLLTSGMTKIKNEYLYLDKDKYRGKGRPRFKDYSKIQPLFINKKS